MVFKGENLGKLLKEALRESETRDASPVVPPATPDTAPAQSAILHAQPEIPGVHQTSPTPDVVATPAPEKPNVESLGDLRRLYKTEKLQFICSWNIKNNEKEIARKLFEAIEKVGSTNIADTTTITISTVGLGVTAEGNFTLPESMSSDEMAEFIHNNLKESEKLRRESRVAEKSFLELQNFAESQGIVLKNLNHTTEKLELAIPSIRKVIEQSIQKIGLPALKECTLLISFQTKIVPEYPNEFYLGLGNIDGLDRSVDEMVAFIAQGINEAEKAKVASSTTSQPSAPAGTPNTPPAQPVSPTINERAEATLSPEEKALKDTRREYADLLKKHTAWHLKPATGGILPRREFRIDTATDQGRIDLDEFNKAERAYADAQLALAQKIGDPSLVFQKVVVEEREALLDLEVSSLSARAKRLATIAVNRFAQEWSSASGTKKRIASALIGANVALLRGTVSAGIPDIMMFVAERLGVGVTSVAASQFAGKIFEKTIEKITGKTQKGIGDVFETQKSKIQNELAVGNLSADGIKKLQAQYDHDFRRFISDRNLRLYSKGAVMMTTAFLVGGKLNSDLAAWHGSGASVPEAPAQAAPKPAGSSFRFDEDMLGENHPKNITLNGKELSMTGGRVNSFRVPFRASEVSDLDAPKTSGIPVQGKNTGFDHAEGDLGPQVKSNELHSTANAETPARELSAMEKASVVEQGEGIWHPVRRQLDLQLKGDPEGFLKQYNASHKGSITLEDLNKDTSGALRRGILDRETTSLLKKQNFIGENGSETWVARKGVHISLDENNHIHIGVGDEEALYQHTPKPIQTIEDVKHAKPTSRPATSLSANSHADTHIPPEDLKPRRVDYLESSHTQENAVEEVFGNPKFDSYYGGNGVEQAPVETMPSFARSFTQGAEMPKGSALNNAVEFSNYGKEIVHAIGLDFENMEKASVFGKMSAGNLLNTIPDYRSGMEAVRDNMSLKIENSAGTLELPVTKELVLLSEAIRLENLTRVTHQGMSFADLFNQFGDRIANRLSVISQYGKENF